MSLEYLVMLLRGGVYEIVLLVAPVVLSALAVGLVVSILQAATSIQEQTLTFVPKLLAILAVLALLGGWMFSSLRDYTINLFQQIPAFSR
ncbi:MAG: flagellar biosynthesis protein FliQ [Treponemataceae bacterium]|nr:MAG: flagellar biosynthesis protein FliQ [Treponemataceae bacterium]